ncbi:hypothetical protein ACFQ3Z_37135 [Streptomyces nogalater]
MAHAKASPVSHPAGPMPVAGPSSASSRTCAPAPTAVSCRILASYVSFRATAHPPAE